MHSACTKVGARAAVLRGSNKEVVVKVLKPGVEDILTTDLSFLYLASRVLEFLNPELERTSLAAIIGDIRASMLDEACAPYGRKGVVSQANRAEVGDVCELMLELGACSERWG